MTVKASEIIIDALEMIIVQAEEADIGQAEAKAGIRTLNDMMLDWDANGIDLGYTTISNLGDVITVAPGAIRGIKANLALELAPRYTESNISPLLLKTAQEGYQTCIDLTGSIADSQFPGTLPQGSGNQQPGYNDNVFYDSDDSTVLSETGGSIALEEDTE